MKVLLGLSGGVDSAVALYLLLKEGYEVEACFMRNWDALANNDYLGNPTINDDICPQEQDYQDALAVANLFNVKLYRVDFVKEYWDNVFAFFLAEYECGRTPNPDILCNKYIKFDAFLKYAKEHGFDKIAMGHYADITLYNKHYYIKKCLDETKDQTYFLSELNEEQIKTALFPLGKLTKKDVRQIAKKLQIPIADKKDSTGICFIGEREFRSFLENYIPAKTGDIIDMKTGNKIGQHRGVFYYTIGQHRGLGIGGIHGQEAKGWYIVKKDVLKNILYVQSGDEEKYLYSDEALIKNISFIDINDLLTSDDVYVKFRYRQKDIPAKITMVDNNTLRLSYAPFKAVTPGQEAVIYANDGRLIASGRIDATYREGRLVS